MEGAQHGGCNKSSITAFPGSISVNMIGCRFGSSNMLYVNIDLLISSQSTSLLLKGTSCQSGKSSRNKPVLGLGGLGQTNDRKEAQVTRTLIFRKAWSRSLAWWLQFFYKWKAWIRAEGTFYGLRFGQALLSRACYFSNQVPRCLLGESFRKNWKPQITKVNYKSSPSQFKY